MSNAAEIGLEQFGELARGIEREVGKVIVGQRNVLRSTLICVLAGGHALLEGVPGLGKTMLIRTLGDVLDLQFARIQFTPTLCPRISSARTSWKRPKTDGGNSAFSRSHLRQPGAGPTKSTAPRPKPSPPCWKPCRKKPSPSPDAAISWKRPFFVLATQNPLEMEGTYPLPEAQLDRFLSRSMCPSRMWLTW